MTKASESGDESEVLQAQIGVAEAQQQLAEAQAAGSDTSVPELQLRLAWASLDSAREPPDTTAERGAVDDASTSVETAAADLAALQSATGVKLPFCEVVFVPSLPGVVDNPPTGGEGAGQASGAGTAWARIASGQLVLKATVSGAEYSLLKQGMAVSFGEGDTPGTGTIAAMAPATGQGTEQYALTIVADQPMTSSSLGENVRIAIPVKSSGGDVLVVPLAAVRARSDGSAKVTKVTADGAVAVAVKAGLSADGYVEADPVPGGGLQAGDRVMVGP